ncbi:TetR/AcrR family transcriptional regulator [Nocardioides speluncae]|uniref:TetR/AcrR family transcriptional regulator n=1 Tax=Nocardioides speluncae TaxID=2670337 RepID=UPI000D69820A|nr:TetR/AcrR family transcriptional regulator [Nocardioides speluncae]
MQEHSDKTSVSDLPPREQIAVATAILVAERGLEGATLRRVAERLSCTTGFISHYYSSKDDLLEAALGAAVQELVRAASTGPAPRTVGDWVERVVEALPNNEHSRRFWRVLVVFQAASLTSARLAEVLCTYSEEKKPHLFALLRAQASPNAPDSAVRELTDSVWVLCDGFGTTAAINPQTFQPDFVRTALNGAIRELLAELQETYS